MHIFNTYETCTKTLVMTLLTLNSSFDPIVLCHQFHHLLSFFFFNTHSCTYAHKLADGYYCQYNCKLD